MTAVRRNPATVAIGAVTLLTVLGCGNPDRQKLVGSWVVEAPDRVERRVEGAGMAAEETPRMTVRFRWNGSLETETRMANIRQAKFGTWELLETDEEAGTSTLECVLTDTRAPPQTTKLVIEWVDERTIRMTPPNMAGLEMSMRFRKE